MFRSYSGESNPDPIVIAKNWGRVKSKQGIVDVLPVSWTFHQLQLLPHQLLAALAHGPKEETTAEP